MRPKKLARHTVSILTGSKQTIVCRAAQEAARHTVSILTGSRQTIVCRAAQEAARHTVSILTGRKKMSFSHLCISVIPYPIGTKFFLQSFPPARGVYIPSLKEIAPAISEIRAAKASIFFHFFFFMFSHTCKNCYNTQMRTPIALKFDSQKGSPKANPSIKCGVHPINGSGVMTDYSHKTRSICCHVYRVNRFME